MGNCLFVDEKPIRVMKPDGKILEYKSPARVFQVLSDFSKDHAISDAVPVTGHHLQPSAKLLSDHLYYLIPTQEKPKKAVRFAEVETVETGRVVRVKVVMTKKELEELVGRGGITADEMICKIESGSGEVMSCRSELEEDEDEQFKKWKPVLETIPESHVCLLA